MSLRSSTDQIAFRYRPADSSSGVSRQTAKRLAERLDVDETQVIHLALQAMAVIGLSARLGKQPLSIKF